MATLGPGSKSHPLRVHEFQGDIWFNQPPGLNEKVLDILEEEEKEEAGRGQFFIDDFDSLSEEDLQRLRRLAILGSHLYIKDPKTDGWMDHETILKKLNF